MRRWPTLVGFGVLAACSGGDDGAVPSTEMSVPTTSPRTTAPIDEQDEPGPIERRPLAEVCPDTIVVQTESLPTVEHGPLYAMLPAGPTFDDAGQRVSGPLRRSDGTIEDVTIEIRSGGPAIGFMLPLRVVADGDADLAETSFAELALVDVDATGVVALTTGSHDMVMWDPDTHPAVESLTDLGELGVETLHVTGEPFVDFLVATDVLDPDQLRPGSDGTPAVFVTENGAIARQGDALLDPTLYASLTEWGRPVAFQRASEVGWDDVDDILAVDANGRLDDACLEQLVPVVQGAIAFYADQPGPTNELIREIRSRFNPLNLVGADVLDDAAGTAVEGGWFVPADGRPIGDLDLDRLTRFAPRLTEALDRDPVDPSSLVTDRYLDPTVTG